MQSIINSAVHSSTGASPVSLLFENQHNLNRGILTKFPDDPELPISAWNIIADMLLIQQQLNNMAETHLKSADKLHVAVNVTPETIFETGSYEP